MGSVRELSDAPITSKESTSQVSYVAVVAFGDLRPARLWTRVDEVDVRGRRGARVATLPRRRAYACFDVRRRDAQSISGSLGRQMLLLCFESFFGTLHGSVQFLLPLFLLPLSLLSLDFALAIVHSVFRDESQSSRIQARSSALDETASVLRRVFDPQRPLFSQAFLLLV